MGVIANSSRITSITAAGANRYSISTEGLIAYYDADDSTCWNSAVATTLTDLSPNGANLTAYGSINTSIIGSAKAWDFNSTGKYFEGSISNAPTRNLTLEAWIYPGASEVIAGDRGTIIYMYGGNQAYMSWNKDNRYLSSFWYGHTPLGYYETNGPSSRSAWHHWCSIWDYGHGYVYQYVDGTVTKTASVGDASPGGGLNIGRESSTRQFSGGIAIIRIYRRALFPTEVYDHWLVEKGRFGL